MGQNRKKHRINGHPIIHFPTSEGVSKVSEWVSAAEGASKASGPEQANEWAVQAKDRTDERVAQNLHLCSFLFSTTVTCRQKCQQNHQTVGPLHYLATNWRLGWECKVHSYSPHPMIAIQEVKSWFHSRKIFLYTESSLHSQSWYSIYRESRELVS